MQGECKLFSLDTGSSTPTSVTFSLPVDRTIIGLLYWRKGALQECQYHLKPIAEIKQFLEMESSLDELLTEWEGQDVTESIKEWQGFISSNEIPLLRFSLQSNGSYHCEISSPWRRLVRMVVSSDRDVMSFSWQDNPRSCILGNDITFRMQAIDESVLATSGGNLRAIAKAILAEFPTSLLLQCQTRYDDPSTNQKVFDSALLNAAHTYVIGRGQKSPRTEKELRICLDPSLGAISSYLLGLYCTSGKWYLERYNPGNINLNGRLLRPSEGVRTPPSEESATLPDGIALLHGDRIGVGPYLFEYLTDRLRRVDHLEQGEITAYGLKYPIRDRESKKVRYILSDVTTCIKSGEFIGILGGSGQGKSTLLNALSGLKPAPQGSAFISGIPSEDLCKSSPGFIGFVPQDDIFHRELSVDQAFTYAARLRLTLKKTARKAVIEQILHVLHLTEHRGKPIHKLSGGQRKRCSIGIEMLSKPAVLFLDEPSSGLDPATEADLMVMLQSLASTKLTVVCTTHVLQTAHIFNRLFFVHDGKIIFEGSTEDAERFFDENYREGVKNHVMPLERIYPAVLKGTQTAEQWRNKFDQELRIAKINPPQRDAKAKVAPPKIKTTGFVRQFFTLIFRQLAILRADFRNVLFLVAQCVLIGLLVAIVAEKEGLRMFLGLIAAMWFGCSNGAQQIVGELPIFKREHLCGLGMHAYITSKFTFQSVVSVLQSLILFFVITLTSHLIHPNELDSSFEERLILRDHPGKMFKKSDAATGSATGTASAALSTTEEEAYIKAQKSGDSIAIERARKDLQDSGYRDDEITKLVAQSSTDIFAPSTIPHQETLTFFAKWFRLQHNLVPNAGDSSKLPSEQIILLKSILAQIPMLLVALNCLGLKIGAFAVSALAGVAMGLAVSSLVISTTQAVMWVPLLLIPQILLGGYVINLCDMPGPVRIISNYVPSFCVQRMVDISHLFGRTIPSLSNRTETPTFMTYGDGKGDPVKWRDPITGNEMEQQFYKESDVNISWQNLRVKLDNIGQHKIAEEQIGDASTTSNRASRELEIVDRRYDVAGKKFDYFIDLTPAYFSLTVLVSWITLSYVTIWVSLVKQRGT